VRTSWPGGRGWCSHQSRKVRTSQSRVIANSNPGRLAGKCHRKQTATLAVVRVKRCGKSAPASRVTGVAWQTPPEARSRRPHRKVWPRRRLRAARPSLRVDRLRHPATVCPDGWSPPCRRCLRRGGGEQNPAYRPTRPPYVAALLFTRCGRRWTRPCVTPGHDLSIRSVRIHWSERVSTGPVALFAGIVRVISVRDSSTERQGHQRRTRRDD
jgi:hypothetical protein